MTFSIYTAVLIISLCISTTIAHYKPSFTVVSAGVRDYIPPIELHYNDGVCPSDYPNGFSIVCHMRPTSVHARFIVNGIDTRTLRAPPFSIAGRRNNMALPWYDHPNGRTTITCVDNERQTAFIAIHIGCDLPRSTRTPSSSPTSSPSPTRTPGIAHTSTPTPVATSTPSVSPYARKTPTIKPDRHSHVPRLSLAPWPSPTVTASQMRAQAPHHTKTRNPCSSVMLSSSPSPIRTPPQNLIQTPTPSSSRTPSPSPTRTPSPSPTRATSSKASQVPWPSAARASSPGFTPKLRPNLTQAHDFAPEVAKYYTHANKSVPVPIASPIITPKLHTYTFLDFLAF